MRYLLLSVCVLLSAACSGRRGSGGGPDGSFPDFGAGDASTDASLDGSTDAGVDAGHDAGHDGGRDSGTGCVDSIAAEVATHITDMATTGWRARNASSGMLMFGCAGATTPAGCMASYPEASTTAYGTQWETIPDGVTGAHLRVLYTTSYRTSYWTRSSPDGRFAVHGCSHGLCFIDLQPATPRVFYGDGLYDPSFFPDGSGFVVQGVGGGGGAAVCEQSVLTSGTPTMLTFTETGCGSGGGIGLYEHLGVSLDGADYWSIDGDAAYDSGGHSTTYADPDPAFNSTSSSTVHFLTNTGTRFTVGGSAIVRHANEGDAVMSPSNQWMLTRHNAPQLGYTLHRLDVTGTGTTRTITAPIIGRYCTGAGAKPEFSYDERWMVYHHYIAEADAEEMGFTGPTDPGYAAYLSAGASQIYLVDLLTGDKYRLTNMQPGQYAFAPHFRSDGWIVFIVQSPSSTPEHIVVSDAALVLGG